MVKEKEGSRVSFQSALSLGHKIYEEQLGEQGLFRKKEAQGGWCYHSAELPEGKV